MYCNHINHTPRQLLEIIESYIKSLQTVDEPAVIPKRKVGNSGKTEERMTTRRNHTFLNCLVYSWNRQTF